MENSYQNRIKIFKKNLNKKFKYLNLIKFNIKYPENKFLIYTRGRTGSNVLTELLNCHPEILCDTEIFNFMYCKSRVLFPQTFIKCCSKRATLNNKSVYGFKVKIAQLRFEHKYKNYDKILQNLSDKGWKFLHLKRNNFLRHKLSNLLMAETKISHIKSGDNFIPKKITVDCNVLLKGIEYSEEVEKIEEENLKLIPHLKISYEKDLEDNSKHQETADRIFKYLNLKPHRVNTTLKRITSDNLEEIILNYDEVYNFFKNTEYRKYLV